MATAPIKSQPLHNFSLPHLRWVHKNSPHQQSPPHSTVHHRRDSPDFDPPGNDTTAVASKPASRTPRKPQPFSSPCFTSLPSASSTHQNQKAEPKDDVVEEGQKPWNLRPRKVVTYPTSTAAFTTPSSFRKNDKEKEKLQEENVSSLRNSNMSNESVLLKSSSSWRVARGGVTVAGEVGGGVVGQGFAGTERQQRKVVEEKRKLWISLSKEEIEEDVYSLTGSRPSRRPKKRPRTVQKQLDNVFPGLYLVGLSIDSYRVHDSLVLRGFRENVEVGKAWSFLVDASAGGFPTLLGAELIIVFSYQSESYSRFTNGGDACFPFSKDICVCCFFYQEQH